MYMYIIFLGLHTADEAAWGEIIAKKKRRKGRGLVGRWVRVACPSCRKEDEGRKVKGGREGGRKEGREEGRKEGWKEEWKDGRMEGGWGYTDPGNVHQRDISDGLDPTLHDIIVMAVSFVVDPRMGAFRIGSMQHRT